MTTQNETNLARAPWGQHLVLDFNGCPNELLADKVNILDWSKELVRAIDMVAYGEPVIEHFATHSHEAAGFTLLQMIETSKLLHISLKISERYILMFFLVKHLTSKLHLEFVKNISNLLKPIYIIWTGDSIRQIRLV